VNQQPEDGAEPPEGWDPKSYAAIGESDRMTLKFVKPAE
jgi:predicted methyltransferase